MREMLSTYWPSLENARGLSANRRNRHPLTPPLEDAHLHAPAPLLCPGCSSSPRRRDPLTLRGLDDGEAQVLKRDPDCPNRTSRRAAECPRYERRRPADVHLLTCASTEDPRFDEDVVRLTTLASNKFETGSKRSTVDSAMMLRGRDRSRAG